MWNKEIVFCSIEIAVNIKKIPKLEIYQRVSGNILWKYLIGSGARPPVLRNSKSGLWGTKYSDALLGQIAINYNFQLQ